jgi:hypothetical protein
LIDPERPHKKKSQVAALLDELGKVVKRVGMTLAYADAFTERLAGAELKDFPMNYPGRLILVVDNSEQPQAVAVDGGSVAFFFRGIVALFADESKNGTDCEHFPDEKWGYNRETRRTIVSGSDYDGLKAKLDETGVKVDVTTRDA